MADKDQGTSELLGASLPATGGDLIDAADDEGRERRLDDGGDTSGHLYTGGPSTQGEFTKRAPGDNPHGER